MGLSNKNKTDIYWTFVFLGTAIGAGILFLPIQAGLGGVWVFLTSIVLILPASYLSHKAFTQVILSQSTPMDFTGVVKHYFGSRFTAVLNILFFITMFLLLIIFTIGLNNDLGCYLKLLGLTKSNLSQTYYFSFLILLVLLAFFKLGDKYLIKFIGILSLILSVLLLFVSFYLIPLWNLSIFKTLSLDQGFLKNFLEVYPLVVSSFIFFPAISSMTIKYRTSKNNNSIDIDKKIYKVILWAISLLGIFFIFFTLSCMFALDSKNLQLASQNNVSCLVAITYRHKAKILTQIGPLISVFALVTSFFGLMLGARSSAHELIQDYLKKDYQANSVGNNNSRIDTIILLIFLVVLWLIAISNISIIHVIGILITPLGAFFLYILPVYIFFKVPSLKKYRKMINIIVMFLGILALCSYVLSFFV